MRVNKLRYNNPNKLNLENKTGCQSKNPTGTSPTSALGGPLRKHVGQEVIGPREDKRHKGSKQN